jgi:uncharacterized protein (DUF58 family)
VTAPLFTPEELARLDRLRSRGRRSVRGANVGERRSPRVGQGTLFADHRPYAPGDDLRSVDWNVYGRLGAMVVKRFEAEERLDVLLLVDRSASMEGAKARKARRIAGAIAHVALARADAVRLAWIPALGPAPAVHRGRGRASALLDELARAPQGGGTDHAAAVKSALRGRRRRGVAVVISDFYDPAGAMRGLITLRAHRFDCVAVHVLDARDVDLPEALSVVAVDRETGEEMTLDVTPDLAERVHQAWRRRAEGLERWCVAHEIPYQRADAARPLWSALRAMIGRGVAVLS